MSDASLNLYDIDATGATDLERKLIDLTVEPLPELQIFPPKPRKGHTFETLQLVERAQPKVFTRPGRGVATEKDRYDRITNECFPFMRKMSIDILSEDVENNVEGFGRHWDRRRANEGQNLLERFGKQLYYGRQGDAQSDPNGFPGFNDLANPDNDIDASLAVWNERADFSDAELNVGDAGALTDAYLCVAAPDPEGDGLAWFWGGNKQVTFTPETQESETNPDTGETYPVRVQYMRGWVGLQNYTAYDVVRIKNVPTRIVREAASGNAMFLMNVITKAMDEYPSNWVPTHLIMHHKAYTAMHNTIQNYNQDGAGGNIVPLTENGQPSRRFSSIPDYNLTIVKSRIMPSRSTKS